MKKFKILILISILLFFSIPNFIKAEELTYGDCIEKYGSFELVAASNDNAIGSDVRSHLKSIEGNSAKFYFNVISFSNYKVKNINYTINASDGSCSGTIQGGQIDNNEGNVMFYLNVDKDKVKSIDVSGTSVKRSDPSKSESTKSVSLDVQTLINNFKGKGDGTSISVLTPDSILKCDNELKEKVKYYWKYVVILSPMLLIVMGTLDFVKAIMANDSDAVKKSSTNALKRTIAMIILLFLPMLLKIIFTWFGIEGTLCF